MTFTKEFNDSEVGFDPAEKVISSENQEKILALKHAIKKDKRNAELHFRLGEIYFFLSDYWKAIDCFNDAINFSPNHYNAILYLGRAYSNLKYYNSAKLTFEKLHKLSKI